MKKILLWAGIGIVTLSLVATMGEFAKRLDIIQDQIIDLSLKEIDQSLEILSLKLKISELMGGNGFQISNKEEFDI
jgi:hypothetical protein